MIKTVSVKTMRESDAAAIAGGIPSKTLMMRAGEGIFRSVRWKEPVAIVCGKGNNAGDGYVVAELLRKNGISCTLVLLSDSFSEDGRYYYEICRENGIAEVRFTQGMSLSGYGTILDCILGTGFSGTITGITKEAIDAINESRAYVVSADIPSGLNGDTGDGETFVRSDLTISIGTFKTGHFTGRCYEAMRDKLNVDIGIQIIGPYAETDDANDRKVRLFFSQKETLDTFLKNHAITEAQYQKSYGDLVVKMGMQEIATKKEQEETE